MLAQVDAQHAANLTGRAMVTRSGRTTNPLLARKRSASTISSRLNTVASSSGTEASERISSASSRRACAPVPSEADFDWNVTRDLDKLDPENENPTGICSDGNVVWIADSGQDQLFAYRLDDGARLPGRDLELDERNRDPRGIWSDGTVMYVVDSVKDGCSSTAWPAARCWRSTSLTRSTAVRGASGPTASRSGFPTTAPSACSPTELWMASSSASKRRSSASAPCSKRAMETRGASGLTSRCCWSPMHRTESL